MPTLKKHKKPNGTLRMVLILIVTTMIVLGIGLGIFIAQRQPTTPTLAETADSPQPFTPYLASFEIVIDGEKRTFTDPRYHNKSADVYIAPEGAAQGQVTVTKPNTTWADLFKTLPMSLTSSCITTGTGQQFCTNATRTLRFYIDNVETPNALEAVITPGSQLRVTY